MAPKKMEKESIKIGSPEIMRAIRSKNTRPELFVRAQLRFLGLTGYRLHRKELPGCPDIAFIGKRKALFVHGCFWHGHECKAGLRKPQVNTNYWEPKIKKNVERDSANLAKLSQLGWQTLVIWQCELTDIVALSEKLTKFMNG